MTEDTARKYLDFVTKAYKSLDNPDYSFVKRVSSGRPYAPLIKRVRDYAAVEELIEADDDVCFSYLLKGRVSLWKLDLSMIGPFGLFVRLGPTIRPQDFVHPTKNDLTDYERKILAILSGGGIKLLTTRELSLQVPLTLYNTTKENVRLYQALFSDRDDVPWEPAAAQA